MFCSNCGKKIEDNSQFYSSCGTSINNSSENQKIVLFENLCENVIRNEIVQRDTKTDNNC